MWMLIRMVDLILIDRLHVYILRNISWKCKRLSTVSKSQAEAKYGLRLLLQAKLFGFDIYSEFGVFTQGLTLLVDNTSATQITNTPLFYEQTKHIGVDWHFFSEKIMSKALHIPHVSSHLQWASISQKLRQGLGMTFSPANYYSAPLHINLRSVEKIGPMPS